MATPILPGNPAGIASTTTAGTSEPSAQQVPAGPAMPAPAVRHVKRSPAASSPPPTLDQALQVVLGAIALAQALEVIGMVLAAAMPDPVREDVADALAKLARRRGAEYDQQRVLHLLNAPPDRSTAARIPPDMPAPARLTVSAVVLRLVPRVAT